MAALAMMSVAASAMAFITVTGNYSGTNITWGPFEMAGTNGGRMGIWATWYGGGYSNSGDERLYEYFTPGMDDVRDYVAAAPSERRSIARKLKFRYAEAVDYCQSVHGATLVSIRNREERDFIISLMPNNLHGFWLGLKRNSVIQVDRPERYTAYNDGTPVTYFSWAPGEPTAEDDEMCIYQGINAGDPSAWVDASCHIKRRAVCKRPVAPPTPGTTTTTEEPSTRGAAKIGASKPPPIEDYGACVVNDADPTAQQSQATIPNTVGAPGNTYLIRNYSGSGDDLGVDPSLQHYARSHCCYKYVNLPKETFANAERKCQEWGRSMQTRGGEGHLARIISPAMNMFLYRLKLDVGGRLNNDKPWIGGKVRNGKIEWTDGRLWDHVNNSDGWEPWYDQQPDGDHWNQQCMLMGGGKRNDGASTDQSHWSDGNCAERRQYFCGYCTVPIDSESPTAAPTKNPTSSPTESPTLSPSLSPTKNPTHSPTENPTMAPTPGPTTAPTCSPSPAPTAVPSPSPTQSPIPDRSVCSEFGYQEYSGPDGVGYPGTNAFCCYKHISPSRGNRTDFAEAVGKCVENGVKIANYANQTTFGRGYLAHIIGPDMNTWLTTVIYDGMNVPAASGLDKSWIAARRDQSEYNLTWEASEPAFAQSDYWDGAYPWGQGEPSVFSRRGGEIEECVSVGDGSRQGKSTWNDASCTSKRQAFCQYCYAEPPHPTDPTEEPTPKATSTTTTTTEEPNIDCGNIIPDPADLLLPSLPEPTTTTKAPTPSPSPYPTTSTPTDMPTIHIPAFIRDDTATSNAYTIYPGPQKDLGFTGRNSAQGYCAYRYFSRGVETQPFMSYADAESFCSESVSGSGPGEGHLAFPASIALNRWLYDLRSQITTNHREKSWVGGMVSKFVNGSFYVDPRVPTPGGDFGTDSGSQRFVDANGSASYAYPWFEGEPSETIPVGAGPQGPAFEVLSNNQIAEACVQMGKGALSQDTPPEEAMKWNDAACAKKRPFFCQYCYFPPDAYTASPVTTEPSTQPTISPTMDPTIGPTVSPSVTPTPFPTTLPTEFPTSSEPTANPTKSPSISPTSSPTELVLCSESTAAGAVLDLASKYGSRWEQTCYGVSRTDAAWLCGCWLVMRPAERALLFPNECRLSNINNTDVDAISAIDGLLDLQSDGSSAVCPNYVAPDNTPTCRDIKCASECKSISSGGLIPDDQPQCGWSRKRKKCKLGAYTSPKEEGLGCRERDANGNCILQCRHEGRIDRCESYTCGQDCYDNRAAHAGVGGGPPQNWGGMGWNDKGCGWSSRKHKCIFGAYTREDEKHLGICGL